MVSGDRPGWLGHRCSSWADGQVHRPIRGDQDAIILTTMVALEDDPVLIGGGWIETEEFEASVS
jgi:hypothetical protein